MGVLARLLFRWMDLKGYVLGNITNYLQNDCVNTIFLQMSFYLLVLRPAENHNIGTVW